ncbi:dUTPase-like protein [Aspergillus ambiguus]|uniref:dUTPase-like protein n=1 Tax=Aspergillus ambiguus TaxID=176160 RepID=UPI003CCCD2ED
MIHRTSSLLLLVLPLARNPSRPLSSSISLARIMTKETTPPPPQSTESTTAAAVHHNPPSLPASPVSKRTKPNPTNMAIAQSLPPLQVKKLSDAGRAPTRGSAFAAGYDMYSAKDTVIPAKGKALVDTGIAIAVPEGTYGRIAPRSGLAAKHFIDTGAGVIDADYRGEVKVLLFNFSEVDFTIKEGDRIAQLVLERIYTPEVEVVEELAESVRGAGGFGSTGN